MTTTDKITKLEVLPCPFCGADASVENTGSEATSLWSVGCNSTTEMCMGYQSLTSFARRSDAIAAWNKRAPADAS